MQRRNVWFATLVLLLALAAISPALAAPEDPMAPLLGQDAPQALPGRYIVVFKDVAAPGLVDAAMDAALQDTAADAHALAPEVSSLGGASAVYRYDAALNGFAAPLSARAVEALRRNPHVDYIQVDSVVTLDTTQTGATWGLDRIDQRALPLNNTYNYDYTGAGVTAYIIDTGILIEHNEFGNRASYGYDAVDGTLPAADCNGHGTHVAGTVGGSTYGVAKGVSLVAVRVLDCSGSGTTSGVVAGVNWVTSNHQAGQPAVANMSLGGGIDTALDTAVANSIADGVTYAIAAGNSKKNACNYSPARVPSAITVGATDNTDARAYYSNYGSCLDIFAPGSSITSAWYTGTAATNTISGTSMATPHVAGAAALYLQANPGASPAAVASALVGNATAGVVGNEGTGSPDRLLYTLFGGTSPTVTPDPTVVPTATPLPTATPVSGDITLTATRRVAGRNVYADLRWNGATASYVDIYRNGYKLVTTPNDGLHSDKLKTVGTYRYKVCNQGTTVCSNEASVTR